MNDWQPSEWDRGYEAGRKAGIAEATAQIEATSYDFSYKKYVQAGAEAERNRIIKLLEETYADHWHITKPHLDRLIALIKGEK